MHILLVTTHLKIGGVSQYLLNLAKGLTRQGHTVSIASSGGELTKQLPKYGINHIAIDIKTKSMFSPKILFCLKKLLKKKPYPDIIHAHTRVTQILSILFSKITGSSYVATCHGFFKPHIMRKLLPCWGEKTIAISDAVSLHLEHDFQIKKENIHTIYNGIDLSNYTECPHTINQSKKQLGLEDHFVIGIIARLSDVKGHKYLIYAFQQVLEKYPFCKLAITGDGKLKTNLMELVQTLKLNNSVHFYPQVENVAHSFAALDLFVLPSIHEGLGLALLEAMACGVPIIASNVGGIPSVIQHEINGLLVEPKNTTELANAIIRMIQNKSLQNKFSKTGKKTVTQKFTLEHMIEQTQDVYKKAILKKELHQ